MSLTSIANRLTPSAPMEITFGAQPIATGRKITTLFGHMAASPGSGLPYQVHEMINVGDYNSAKLEVEALAGAGAQIAKMAEAFVKANALVSGGRNFPAFRVVLIPNAVSDFGPADEALEAIKLLRNDLLVSCYPSSNSAMMAKLVQYAQLMSGIDRDLNGQFGTFVMAASLDQLSTQLAYAINKREVVSICFPDTNTALIEDISVNTTNGSKFLTNVASVAGIYPGAICTATGVPVGAKVVSVSNGQVELDVAATATATGVSADFQNVQSQAVEIVAASCAAAMMQSAFPYNPLQGVAIGGLIPPKKSSDKIIIDPNGSSEAALVAGLAPLTVQPGGSVAFIRTRTTLTQNPDTSAVTAYFDWQDVVVLYDFREVCYQITQNPPFNNNPGGTKASARTAALLKDEILREAQNFEDNGAFQNVKISAKKFLVQPSSTSKGRFDFKIPVEVVPGLYVIAGNIVAVSDLTTYTL